MKKCNDFNELRELIYIIFGNQIDDDKIELFHFENNSQPKRHFKVIQDFIVANYEFSKNTYYTFIYNKNENFLYFDNNGKQKERLRYINLAFQNRIDGINSESLFVEDLLKIVKEQNENYKCEALSKINSIKVNLMLSSTRENTKSLCFKMYDMKFGSSNLIFNSKNQNDFLLIDCGSKSSKESLPNSLKEIKNDTLNGKFNTLITHFHDDHYKHFCELNRKFDKVLIYDPFYYPELLELSFIFLCSMAAKGKGIQPNETYVICRFFLNEYLKQCISSSTVYYFLCPGSTFDACDRTFIVLKRDDDDKDAIKNFLIKNKTNIDNIFNSLLDEDNKINNIYNKIKDITRVLSENRCNLNIKRDLFNDINLLKEILSLFDKSSLETNFRLSRKLDKKFLDGFTKKIKIVLEEHDINISIVDEFLSILVCGDISNHKTLNSCIKRLNQYQEDINFHIITAPHHGSSTFFDYADNGLELLSKIRSDYIYVSWSKFKNYRYPALCQYLAISKKVIISNLDDELKRISKNIVPLNKNMNSNISSNPESF